MFLPENINLQQSKEYILSIRLIPSGFYFSIHHCEKRRFYQHNIQFEEEDYLKSLQKVFFDTDLFSNNFKAINVVCVNEKAIIVPNSLYERKYEEKLMDFNFINPGSYTTNSELSYLDSKIVWSMNKEVFQFLSRSLLNPNFKNHLSLLIPYLYNNYHNKHSSSLFINFNDDNMMDCVAFRKKGLLLAKTFIIENPLEGYYFIQKVWNELRMNTANDSLFFSDRTTKYDSSIELSKKIIPECRNIDINITNENSREEKLPIEIKIIYENY